MDERDRGNFRIKMNSHENEKSKWEKMKRNLEKEGNSSLSKVDWGTSIFFFDYRISCRKKNFSHNMCEESLIKPIQEQDDAFARTFYEKQ